MKYYEKLLEIGCFTLRDAERITGSEAAAKWLMRDYLKRGYIERVKRDLYVPISLETKQPICNRFQIASALGDDACVSYHSAFECYGYANQVFYELYVTSTHRFADFAFDGVTYKQIAPRIELEVTEMPNLVRVTSLERTVIDSINLFPKIGGLEELVRCLALIPSLNEAAMLRCLEAYGNGFLYQKAGYILSAFSETIGISDAFFNECRKHLPNCKSYLYDNRQSFVWHEKWKLYAPAGLTELTNKGVNDFDAV